MDNSKSCSFPSVRILAPVGIALLAFLTILFAGSVTQAENSLKYIDDKIWSAPSIDTSNYDSTNFIIKQSSKRTYQKNLSGSGIVNFTNETNSVNNYLCLTGNNSDFSGSFYLTNDNSALWFSSANAGLGKGTLVLSDSNYVRTSLSQDATIKIGALQGSGFLRNDESSGHTITYELGGANKDATFSGQIANTWRDNKSDYPTAISKVGMGTQTFSSSNSYTGGTTISGGTLKLSGNGTLGTGAVTIGENGTLEFAYSSAKTFNNSISLSGTIANTSTATLTLSSAITLSGNATFDTTSDLTVSVNFSGSGSLTKTGAGALTLDYNGQLNKVTKVTVNQGALTLGFATSGSGMLPNNSTIEVIGATSTLNGYSNILGYNNTGSKLYLTNGGSLNNTNKDSHLTVSYVVYMNNGKLTSTESGHSTYGNFILDNVINVTNGTENAIEANYITIRKNANNAKTSCSLNISDKATLKITSVITDGNENDASKVTPLVKQGAGELVLTGVNVYSKGTTISGGTLKLTGNGTLGTGSVTVSENAELEIAYDNPEKSVSISSITMDPQSAIKVTSGTVTFNPGDVSLNNLAGGSLDQSGHTSVASHLVVTGNLTLLNDENEMSKFIGSISAGNYSITKSGNGTLQLYGEAEGSIDASSLIVSSGRLDLKGCLTGQLEVGEGAEFSPGNSVGEAKSDGNFILNQSAKLLIEQDETGIDKLTVKSFTDNGGFINLLINGIPAGSQYDIITATNGFDSSQDESYWLGKLGTLPDYMTLSIITGEYGANSQTVRLLIDRNAVPEPSTWALLALGVIALLLRKRK